MQDVSFRDVATAMLVDEFPQYAMPIALGLYRVHAQVSIERVSADLTTKSNTDADAKVKAGKLLGWDDF